MLPDLTEIIKQQGTYDKYSKWREDYKKWRSGGAQGSKGEESSLFRALGLHQSTETSVQRPTVKRSSFHASPRGARLNRVICAQVRLHLRRACPF